MKVEAQVKFLEKEKFLLFFKSTNKEIFVDKKENGFAEGPNPLELFLSSLGACIGIYAKRYLEGIKIDFKSLEILVNAEFSYQDLILKNIKVEIRTDANLKEKKERFLEFVHNCPIHNTLIKTKEIEITIP